LYIEHHVHFVYPFRAPDLGDKDRRVVRRNKLNGVEFLSRRWEIRFAVHFNSLSSRYHLGLNPYYIDALVGHFDYSGITAAKADILSENIPVVDGLQQVSVAICKGKGNKVSTNYLPLKLGTDEEKLTQYMPKGRIHDAIISTKDLAKSCIVHDYWGDLSVSEVKGRGQLLIHTDVFGWLIYRTKKVLRRMWVRKTDEDDKNDHTRFDTRSIEFISS
jgi:hypothetical protein